MALQGGSVPEILISMKSEVHLKLLRCIEANPDMTQRELANELGISLGKANYCLRELIKKGFVKARNFKNSNNKRAYLYLLTPQGIDEKAKISMAFLRRKINEYEELKHEIEELRREIDQSQH